MSCCRVFRINNDVKKRIVVAFGRYQPPHCGHKTIFDDMISMINDPNNIADEGYIYVMGFPPQPNKRNPLGPNEKLKYLHKMLPNTQIKFIIGNSVGDMLSPETKRRLGDRLIIMPLPTESELAERKELGDDYAYDRDGKPNFKVANLYKLHFWFRDRREENDYMIIAGEDRVSQIKKANKTRETKFPISEAGQKRSAASQTGDVCTVDDSPSGSRIRDWAASLNSFSLNDPKVKKILSFTKLGNMTDEDVLDMVNDIRKVNGKPEFFVPQEEVMLGGSRKTRKKTRRKRRKTKRKKKGGWADGHEPSLEQRGAWRHNISVDRYVQLRRNHMREQERRNRLLENTIDDAASGDVPPEESEEQYISRILREERIREERAREREEAERLVRRAVAVRNYLPQDVRPGNASVDQVQHAERAQYRELEQAREEARRQADIRARTVHRVIQNPDGSIVMGTTVASTEDQVKAMQIQAIAEEEGLSWMDAYRRYNEIHNINTNEIPVTRPSRLRRIRDYLVERARAIRERRVFGRRNRDTRVAPRGGTVMADYTRRHYGLNRRGGRRKKKTRKKRGNGGVFSRKRTRKNISARKPEEKYIDLALEQLINADGSEWKEASVVKQVQMMRHLAIQLEDEAMQKKKGGRRRRKTRRKKKKSRRRRK